MHLDARLVISLLDPEIDSIMAPLTSKGKQRCTVDDRLWMAKRAIENLLSVRFWL